MRISEPEVAPLGGTGRLTSTRQRRNNLNKESSPQPNTTTEAKVRNICCHSNISCCTVEASAGVRGTETSTVSPHDISSDVVNRSLTEQRDTQSPAVAEVRLLRHHRHSYSLSWKHIKGHRVPPVNLTKVRIVAKQ